MLTQMRLRKCVSVSGAELPILLLCPLMNHSLCCMRYIVAAQGLCKECARSGPDAPYERVLISSGLRRSTNRSAKCWRVVGVCITPARQPIEWLGRTRDLSHWFALAGAGA